jgi:hypothetical protein
LVALIKFELALVFGLFKHLFMMDKTGWSGLLLVIVGAGLNLAIYFLLLPRPPIKWEQFEPKKLAEKILRTKMDRHMALQTVQNSLLI